MRMVMIKQREFQLESLRMIPLIFALVLVTWAYPAFAGGTCDDVSQTDREKISIIESVSINKKSDYNMQSWSVLNTLDSSIFWSDNTLTVDELAFHRFGHTKNGDFIAFMGPRAGIQWLFIKKRLGSVPTSHVFECSGAIIHEQHDLGDMFSWTAENQNIKKIIGIDLEHFVAICLLSDAGTPKQCKFDQFMKEYDRLVSVYSAKADDCDKLFELTDLRTAELQHKKKNKQHSENTDGERALKRFIVDSADLPETGSVSFRGLDIDGDGIDDSVIRSCGSGYGRLCSLAVNFSSGGEISKFDTVPFYVAHLQGKVYLVEEIDGKTSPYTKMSGTTISTISRDGIQKMCEHK